MNNLLHNAIESINVGLEDYDRPGRIQSSLRNVHAGILLLFKEKLLRLCPAGSKEVLIKARIRPELDSSGKVVFVGDGKNTVDIQQIKERFKSLRITADWERFDAVTDIRNNVEHYFSTTPPATMREVLAKSFIIIRDFITNELAGEPRAFLGEDKWKILLSVSEVFEKERTECETALRAVQWDSETLLAAVLDHTCDKCESSLVQPIGPVGNCQEVEFLCKACGHKFAFENSVEGMLKSHLWSEIYLSVKDGGEPPLNECSDCGRETFVLEEEKCVACGAELSYVLCDVCGRELGPDEQRNGGLCHYHANHEDRPERVSGYKGFPIDPDFDTDELIEF